MGHFFASFSITDKLSRFLGLTLLYIKPIELHTPVIKQMNI